MLRALAIGCGMIAAAPAFATVTLTDFSVYATGAVAISGGAYGTIASGSFANANGPNARNFSGNSASSAALDAAAAAASRELAGLSATGALTSGQWTPGNATLTGTSDGINVFNIDGARYSGLYALHFAGPGTGAIVNISGAAFSNYANIDFGALSPDQVVFNFYEADNLRMNGMNIAGSILAPNAHVELMGGSVAGSVVAGSFTSAGTLIGGHAFAGLAPEQTAPVPEPATWAMMLGGFALIGVMLRRRRRTIRSTVA
ncbi:MAG TPA: choice-of-anchor A family protein [Sphingomonadaceae bacterium]|nr:choice-of-anchor A family protein [Sphingomonadaceae bacterium]